MATKKTKTPGKPARTKAAPKPATKAKSKTRPMAARGTASKKSLPAKKSPAKATAKATAKKPAAAKKAVPARKPAPAKAAKKAAPAKAAAKKKPAPVKAAVKKPVPAKKPAPAKAAKKVAPVKAAAKPAPAKVVPVTKVVPVKGSSVKVPPAKAASAKAVAPVKPVPAAPVKAAAPAAPAKPAKPFSAKKLGDFACGDYVVYPTHGVGKIEEIVEQEIAGFILRLYVVRFEKEKMTLRVPVNKAEESGLRKLSTRQQIDVALTTLKGRSRVSRAMWSRRAQEYEAKINSGDPVSIAEVVRDLHRNAGQPDQSYSERQIYEAALERLARELAAVEKIDSDAATVKLEQFLIKAA
jgi:CarD family transcriptional regulator